MLKVLKLLKLATRLGMATISTKVSRDSWTSRSGVESLEGSQSFQLFAVKIRGSHAFREAGMPGSLDAIVESKKSAEWWNVINDKNREWTDGPKRQES